ncbi:MAG TPA: hypothetical protein VNX68_14725 [Nitrosopumilaceae archaeon]|jgi:hypothetical protein|nr:hypothetical protein [Nitrosopumilaceae archaeon]
MMYVTKYFGCNLARWFVSVSVVLPIVEQCISINLGFNRRRRFFAVKFDWQSRFFWLIIELFKCIEIGCFDNTEIVITNKGYRAMRQRQTKDK